MNVIFHEDFPQEELRSALQRWGRVALLVKERRRHFEDTDVSSVLSKFIAGGEGLPRQPVRSGTAWLMPGPAGEPVDRWFEKLLAILGDASDSPGLTRTAETGDPASKMARTQQLKSNRESAGSPREALDVEVRIPEGTNREFERLRRRLKSVSSSLAQLDPKQTKHDQLLEATTELNGAFSDFVDQWLRAIIEPIERAFNQQLKSRASATLSEKQDLSKWANAELRNHGLAIRCPKTRRPSILVADPGHHPAIGRFQLQHKAIDGKWKRSFNTPDLPALNLMPDLHSLDVDLAHVLRRIAGAEASMSSSA